MARITVEDCIDKFESRFELVLVASNRARKLHSGENPTVEKNNDKHTVIALREIADETIPVDEMKNNLIEEYQTISLQNEEDLTIENIDLQDDSADDEIKKDVLEVETQDNSESIIEELSYKQDDPDENNEEFSNKQDDPDENNEEFSNKTDQTLED